MNSKSDKTSHREILSVPMLLPLPYVRTFCPALSHILFPFSSTAVSIARAERDGTRAETRFRLSPKRMSPFKSVGASVQSTAGSRGVRISLSNAG